MGIKVLKSGLLSTLQDLGRFGYRKDGIIVSGAMDSLALRTGNLLVGNPEAEAALECTLAGPRILFESEQLIAITGADLSAVIDNVPLQMWRPVLVKKGSVLSFGAAMKGCRTYLSVSGGFSVPKVLGSRSTYLRAGFGGWKGRAWQPGDYIPFRSVYKDTLIDFNWSCDLSSFYPDLNDHIIRVIKGPEYELFSEGSIKAFFEQEFQLRNESDRMGYRLEGAELTLETPQEMISSAVSFGTVQVTSKGDPIVLMADHQTTGGYPRIAQVVTADFSKLAQLRSGQKIRIELVTLAQAHAALLHREQQLKQLKQTLTFKYNHEIQ
jgi:antagonist of KipI